MNIVTFLTAFKNIQFTDSIVAGGAASVIIYTIGALFVSMNVVIPFVGIPLTMGIVGAAAIPLGHLVTALVPDSVRQSIAGLAAKLPKYQSMLPDLYSAPSDFSEAPPDRSTQSNINQANAAVAVIDAHTTKANEKVVAQAFSTGKNGA